MEEKWVTIHIGDGTRRCPESEMQKVLDNIEKVKEHYREKGVPQENVDKVYFVRIEKDEN